MDPGIGLTILGTAIGSAKLVEKVLGPTADYLGTGLAQWTQHRVGNVGRIFSNAVQKLGDRLNVAGTVPPRVLHEILDEGSFCDSQLGAEYFGGVLASSRTETSRDDRGAAHLKTVGRLSTYQIRAHYLFYSAFKKVYDGSDVNLALTSELRNLVVYIPEKSFSESMEFTGAENPFQIVTHITNGLVREELIGSRRLSGPAELLADHYSASFIEPGVCYHPAILGLELFLWVHGLGDVSIKSFLDKSLQLPDLAELPAPEGAKALFRC